MEISIFQTEDYDTYENFLYSQEATYKVVADSRFDDGTLYEHPYLSQNYLSSF